LEGVRLVESGSVSELADAINWVLSIDKNEAQELGIKNREGVLRKFDNSIIVEKFGKILNNLVEKGN
jgi:glycosyltransferase involved in cell wall biosynthesis